MEKYTSRQIEIMEAATARIDKHGIQNLTIKNLAADIGLSEPALYRHFRGKNEILLSLLNYFIEEMQNRIKGIKKNLDDSAGDELREIFKSQLEAFTKKPAIVSVIFAESIFHFDDDLRVKVTEIMDLMHIYVSTNIKKGQINGEYEKLINASTLTTIVIGGIRLTVLKWKVSGHRTNLLKDGKAVIDGVLKMIENK